MHRRHFTAAALACTVTGAVRAQGARPPQVQLGGVMGSKAMLVVNGQPQMLAVGETRGGIRLIALQGDVAQVEFGGRVQSLRVGASPVAVGSGGPAQGGGAREIVLTAGPGGHFITGGAINGQAVSFMVDTGATTVALSQAEATRIGLDLRNGERGLGSTANGLVPVLNLTLSVVRVGDVEVANVAATVLPAQMPHVLLGNSFLTRFNMRRENDVMRLERR